jgi:hypothetical protein
MSKIDIYNVQENAWTNLQFDCKFNMTVNPAITQISRSALIVFGGKIPSNNQRVSKCYVISENEDDGQLAIAEGPELQNKATFEMAFVHDGAVVAIQNNELANRTKLILRYQYL